MGLRCMAGRNGATLMANGNGYEIYIVVRDRDYPLPTEPDPRSAWEAGWYGWTGKAGDVPMSVFGADEYEDALAKAEELSVTSTPELQKLAETIKEYQEWVSMNHPGDLDDDGSGFAVFDEERTDWWQLIVTLAEDTVGLNKATNEEALVARVNMPGREN